MKHRLQGDKKTLASDVWRLGLILAQRWGVLVLRVGFDKATRRIVLFTCVGVL